MKFNTNLEGPKSKSHDNSTSKNMQPMVNLDIDKGKQPLELSTIKAKPKIPHQESTIEILYGTFEHININPLFDEHPSLNAKKNHLKYLKRTSRIDLKQNDATINT